MAKTTLTFLAKYISEAVTFYFYLSDEIELDIMIQELTQVEPFP